MAQIENHGSHDVVVTSVDPVAPAVRVQWSDYVFRPGGDSTGQARPWQDFPARSPAHGMIRLLVTIRKPQQCGPGEPYQSKVNVHWNSLLGSNTTTITLEFAREAFVLCR